MDPENINELFRYLMDYPVTEEPYPPGYPEDLMFEHYPGKDFVVGVCDENIETLVRGLSKAKDPDHRQLIKDYLGLFRDLKAYRLRKLMGKVCYNTQAIQEENVQQLKK